MLPPNQDWILLVKHPARCEVALAWRRKPPRTGFSSHPILSLFVPESGRESGQDPIYRPLRSKKLTTQVFCPS
jgi:hypothetical protein